MADLSAVAGQTLQVRIEARQIILHGVVGVALGVDRDEVGVDAVGIGTHGAKHLRNLEQRGRADIRAMGEAEEDQGRTPLHFLFGHGLAALIGELERSADRGRGGDRPPAAHGPQHHQKTDDQAAGEGRDDHERAGGGPIHFLIPLNHCSSEAGRETRGDHLKEHRGPVVTPQRQRREQHSNAEDTAGDRHRAHPGAIGRGQVMRCQNGLGQSLELTPADLPKRAFRSKR